jgi:hypothetical protein
MLLTPESIPYLPPVHVSYPSVRTLISNGIRFFVVILRRHIGHAPEYTGGIPLPRPCPAFNALRIQKSQNTCPTVSHTLREGVPQGVAARSVGESRHMTHLAALSAPD